MSERNLFAVSIKHTEYKWKFGMPLTLWGYKRTEDNEKRCFGGYTIYPKNAELYSLEDWHKMGYGAWIKTDEPVSLTMELCKKYKKYDTVLITHDEIMRYYNTCHLQIQEG